MEVIGTLSILKQLHVVMIVKKGLLSVLAATDLLDGYSKVTHLLRAESVVSGLIVHEVQGLDHQQKGQWKHE